MPRVTTYGTGRVAPQPLPNARRTNTATPESFGVGAFDQAAGVGMRVLSSGWAEARAQADEVALLDFDTKSAEWERARLHDAQSGVLNTVRGKDALDLARTVGDEYDVFAGELMAGMDERQRSAAQRLSQRRRAGIVGNLDTHATREMARYETDVTEASLSNSVSLAVANAGDLPRVATELQRQELIIDGYAKRQGLAPEKRDAMLLNARTKVHQGVIEHYLNSEQEGLAKTYFDGVKDQIDGAAHGAIERAIEVGTIRGESQRRSDEILASTSTASQALEQVRAIEDPKLRDEVQQRVEHGISLKNALQRESEEQAMIGAVNLLEKSGGNMKAIPPGQWASMSLSQRTALRSYANSLRPDGPGEPKTDMRTYMALRDLASTDPAKFLQHDLMLDIGKLGKTEMKEMVDIRERLRKGEKPTVLDDYRTELQVVNGALEAAGIDPSPSKDKEALSKVAWFRGLVAEEVRRTQSITGKKVTNAELEALTRQVLGQQVLDRGWIWSGSQSLMDADISDVPGADRRQIVSSFQKQGVAKPTDDQILRAWLEQQVRRPR